MAILSKKQTGCPTGCVMCKWIVCILLFLVTVASLFGVFQTHVMISSDPARFALQFGSTSGSLSILAFAVSVSAWCKKMACCMSGSCEVCSK